MRQGEGIRYETLFRDETVGALDAANGKEYVRMLRRAMDLAGFHQVIFICHTPLIWELADNVLSVHDGRVVAGSRESATTENHLAGVAFELAVPTSSITLVVPSGRQASA
jgi:ABC-type lipoprotein export system ATPase subunit